MSFEIEIEKRLAARRRIYLVRHGEVSFYDASGAPLKNRLLALSQAGLAQAEAARAALTGIPIDRAVISSLGRARETAEVILRGRAIALEASEELREVAPGRPRDAKHPDFERLFLGALSEDIGRDTRFLDGETFGSLQDRVLPSFRSLLDATDWKELLIVAHGGTNRVILLHALGLELSAFGRLEQDHGCINVIDVHPDGKLLARLINYTPYSPLKEDLRTTSMEKIYLDYRRTPAAGERGQA